MFFTGWLDNTLLPVESMSVFFISFERCLILKFPMRYGTKAKKRLQRCSFLFCITILIVNGTFLMLEMPRQSHTGIYKPYVYKPSPNPTKSGGRSRATRWQKWARALTRGSLARDALVPKVIL
jgi:hypothetical protein